MKSGGSRRKKRDSQERIAGRESDRKEVLGEREADTSEWKRRKRKMGNGSKVDVCADTGQDVRRAGGQSKQSTGLPRPPLVRVF